MKTRGTTAAGTAEPTRGMGLGAKLGGAFGLVLVLHITVAVMGHAGLDSVRVDMDELDGARRVAMGMAQVDRLVGEVQRQVQGYTHTGNRSLEERAEITHGQLVTSLAGLAIEAIATDRGAIGRMHALLDRYHEQFRLAVADRQRRERLVTTDLLQLSTECADLLARADTGSLAPDETIALARLSRDLLAAQNGAHVYLARLDPEAIRAAHRALEHTEQSLDKPDVGTAIAALGPALTPLLRQFDRVLDGIVQTTRGYLHLVHVVMAAEAVDFLAQSAQLRKAAETRLDHLQHSIRASQARYQWVAATVSLATILLGLVAGGMVTRLVVKPLRRITATFARLARGDAGTDIPGRERRDEIGAMAGAAEVFLRRNAETAALLAATQELSEERAESIAALERSNRELDSFVHVASHDLRAPLRAIKSLVTWLEEDCGPELSPTGKGHLALLGRRVSRMSRLLSDLSEYSRVGRNEVLPELVDVKALVRGCVDLVGSGSALTIKITGPDRQVMVGRIPLEQVVANLLSNAVRHHDRASGCVEAAIGGDSAHLEIAVTDDGPGIPERFHLQVFEPFTTLQPRDVKEGSGIGLAIVRKLVDQYRAVIMIDSPVADGRGTCFRVRWPIHPTTPTAPSVDASRLATVAGG